MRWVRHVAQWRNKKCVQNFDLKKLNRGDNGRHMNRTNNDGYFVDGNFLLVLLDASASLT
jgi:hypothetical protein